MIRHRNVLLFTFLILLIGCLDDPDPASSLDAVSRTDLLNNPFDKLSAHHRPIGTGAVAGVPGGTSNPRAAHPDYDRPGAVGSRGSLARVTRFNAGNSQQGRKYLYHVATSDKPRTIQVTGEGGVRLLMPRGVTYPSTGGDDVVVLWPHDGTGDLVDLFQQFVDDTSHAAHHRTYALGGTDLGDDSDDGDHGTSASLLRFPGTVLRGFEINPAHPAPIQHALDVTATRKGTPHSAQVLGKTMVWPAYGHDKGSVASDENLGDLPYGTRVFIRPVDHWRRNHLGLTDRGKALFDTFSYYGFYVIDGQGQIGPHNGGVLQLRIDQDVDNDVAKGLEADLEKMLPYLYPMRNPRSHADETELHEGLPYAGGGGPLAPNAAGAGSINTAYDAH